MCPELFSDDDLWVVWAAMQAMVNDIHSPQDLMTELQWKIAHSILRSLDAEVTLRNSARASASDDAGRTQGRNAGRNSEE